MPFVSQAQAKWAFATHQPWARRWGKMSRGKIANLPQYVARKNRKWGKRKAQAIVAKKEVPSAIPAVGNAMGPGGLFSASGLEHGSNTHVSIRTRTRKFGQSARRTRPQITLKGEGHSGAMVAFFLPDELADTLAQAGTDLFCDRAEAACDLHITLAYLGKVDDIEGQLPQLVAAVQSYTRVWASMIGRPIKAQIGGYKAFDNVQEDGNIPIYRAIESPTLMIFVEGLKRFLDGAGATNHRDHDPYTPHITIAYTYPELKELLEATPATPHTVLFEQVTLALGDIRIDLPLFAPPPLGEEYKAAASDTAPAAKPKARQGSESGNGAKPSSGTPGEMIMPGVVRVRGNLCHVRGQFGPCDKASPTGFMGKPKKGKGKGGKGKGGGGKGAKPKLTDEQKQQAKDTAAAKKKQEQEAQRVQNRADALAKLSSRPNDDAMKALDMLRAGGQPDGAMLASLEPTGLVKKHANGQYSLSPQGHALLMGLDKGDAGAAIDALGGGSDQVAATADRNAKQTQREADKKKRADDLAQRKAERDKRLAQRKKPARKPASTQDDSVKLIMGGKVKVAPRASNQP